MCENDVKTTRSREARFDGTDLNAPLLKKLLSVLVFYNVTGRMDASHRPSRLLFVACARGRTRRARESAVSFFSEREAGARRARDAKANEFAKAKKYADRRRPPFHFSRGGGFVGRPVDVATLSYPRLRRRRRGGSEVMARLAQTAAGRRAAATKNKKRVVRGSSLTPRARRRLTLSGKTSNQRAGFESGSYGSS